MEDEIIALIRAANRLIPFVQDEADKYEDDGSNEPLEAIRDFRTAVSAASLAALSAQAQELGFYD